MYKQELAKIWRTGGGPSSRTPVGGDTSMCISLSLSIYLSIYIYIYICNNNNNNNKCEKLPLRTSNSPCSGRTPDLSHP